MFLLFTDISALRFIKSASSVRESKFADDFTELMGLTFLGLLELLSLPCFVIGELIFLGFSVNFFSPSDM